MIINLSLFVATGDFTKVVNCSFGYVFLLFSYPNTLLHHLAIISYKKYSFAIFSEQPGGS